MGRTTLITSSYSLSDLITLVTGEESKFLMLPKAEVFAAARPNLGLRWDDHEGDESIEPAIVELTDDVFPWASCRLNAIDKLTVVLKEGSTTTPVGKAVDGLLRA